MCYMVLAFVRAKDANLPAVHFAENCKDLFGNVKHFYRLGSSDDSGNYAERWQKNGMIAIGWPKLGDLQKCDTRGILDRRMIAERLSHIYYNGNESTSLKATRKSSNPAPNSGS